MDIYLQTFGSRLRVRDGIFEMTVPDISGANHHVIEQFAPEQVTSILLHKGTSVSADALLLAIEIGVDIQVLDQFGHPQGRFWSNRPTSTLSIWKNQLALSHTTEGLRIAKSWIEEKLHGRILHLRKLKGYRSAEKGKIITAAETALLELLTRLKKMPLLEFNADAATIRGIEGAAGRHYFDTLSALLPDEYQFGGRSNRPATDAFNAFLNYGYAILYSKAERALLLAGLHPYIGFMHADGYQRKNLVFDFIEQFRVWIDKIVFKLFSRKHVSSVHITLRTEKGYWLAEEGKRLLVDHVLERLANKKQALDGLEYSLDALMTESARRCASRVLKFETMRKVKMQPA
ncbi:MAG: CRISPR-associated endonuclease Cas1 [Saprospiraceae bacterium]|nr:CRISPR-associated endonuclease Cas1 [Saprospiraceae bacterium]